MRLFEQDKLRHMASSGLIVVLLAYFTGIAGATLISLLIGGIKEVVWDKWMKRGCCDPEDLIADVVGALIGAGIMTLMVILL
jgi:hypothetical protein